jgi:Peptidase family M28
VEVVLLDVQAWPCASYLAQGFAWFSRHPAAAFGAAFALACHAGVCPQIAAWMQMAGLETSVDDIGNVHGQLRSANASAERVVLGSHYDTVSDAGAFDGVLGVLAAIAAAKALLLSSFKGQPLQVKGAPGCFPVLYLLWC